MTKKKTPQELAIANYNAFVSRTPTINDAFEYLIEMNVKLSIGINIAFDSNKQAITIEDEMEQIKKMTLDRIYQLAKEGKIPVKSPEGVKDGNGEIVQPEQHAS